MAQKVKQKRAVSYDVESTGLYAYEGDEMFSYSLCDTKGKAIVQRLDGSDLRRLQGQKRLDALWSNTSIAKVMHNAKFDTTFTEKRLGRKLEDNKIHCTHKMSHILQNSHPGHSLEQLSWDLAEYPRVDTKIKRLAKKVGGFQNIDESLMHEYQIADAERTMLLYLFFWPKIQANPKYQEIYQTEMDLIWATMRMEERGLMLKGERARELIIELEEQLSETQEAIYRVAGRRFNINSSNQIAHLLFKQRGLPILKRTKKAKAPAVDKHVFFELYQMTKDELLQLILKYRSYRTGIKNLESYIDVADSDGIIHALINTCQAITSRESVSHPPLQNTAKTGVLLNPFAVPAREAFGPRPDCINIHIDYKGIEMCLLVHSSQDPRMLECLRHGDGDVHSLAAKVFYGRLWEEANAALRKSYRGAGKNANFACPYGAGGKQVAKTLGLPGGEGIRAFNRYKATFPTLVGLSRIIGRDVIDKGYIETAFGRRLYVTRDKPYMGTNYLIQGTAAGIIKRAQNRVYKYNEEQTGGEVKILLPIHDEIVIEYPKNRLKELRGYLQDVRELMVDFPMFDVPMEIDVSVSTSSWEKKKPYRGL